MLSVLIDRNVEREAVTHRSEPVKQTVMFGEQKLELGVLQRVAATPRDDEKFRLDQIPYLATVCLLAKDRRVQLFSSFELLMERYRQCGPKNGYMGLNLLEGVDIRRAPTPFERTVMTTPGESVGTKEEDQMAFFQSITAPRYKEICNAFLESQRSKLLDDAFHLWTAEASGLDRFLTMDQKFWKAVRQATDGSRLHTSVSVVTPKEICKELDVPPTDIDRLARDLHPFR